MKFYHLWICLFLLVLLAPVGHTPLLAQDAPAVPADITADEVNEIASELWCPLCSGVRLDSCELRACDQMKEEIAIKLSEGEDLSEIKQYFVNQYGPQVLGEPPREGFNLLAWILPVLVLVGGGIFVVVRGRSMLRPDEDEPLADSPSPVEEAASAPATHAHSEENASDSYARRLDEELKSYD